MKLLIFCVFLSTLLLSRGALAQNTDAKQMKPFPQTGVLASHGILANMGIAIPQLPMGMTGDHVPLLGSMSLSQARDGQGTWTFKVDNNSETDLKVSVELAQYDGVAGKLSSSSFNYKLKKGSQASEKILAVPRSAGAALILKSWAELKK